jgi:hypothetical protein
MLCTKIALSRQRTLNSGSYSIGMSFTAHWKFRSAETGVAFNPKRLAEVSEKEGWTTHY